MFKKLNIKLNIIYIISIGIILSGSLFVIYKSTEHDTYKNISQRLNANIHTQNDFNNFKNPPPNKESLQEFDNSKKDNYFNDELIVENKNLTLEELIKNNLGDDFKINYDKQIITNNHNYYAYKQIARETKFIDITRDINFLNSFRSNLIKIFSFIIIFSEIFGYFFIRQIIKPVAENYKRQQEFVADASHELKTPLAVLKSCLNLIEKNDDDSIELIKYSQIEINRLTNLTNNLLKLSENTIASNDVINVSYQTNLILSGIEVQLFEKQIDFTSIIEDNLKANITAEEYSQLIHILIDNALKYNDDRQQIKLELQHSKNNILLIVSNTSNPIKEDNFKKLFERFYREDKSRNSHTQGFGLGLSIANHIITKYNGSIDCTYENSYFKIFIKLPLHY